VIEEPSTSTNFLDLSLNIKNSKITATTYQKPMNLYLYISPASAPPPPAVSKNLLLGN
jgi:hypothetical protein